MEIDLSEVRWRKPKRSNADGNCFEAGLVHVPAGAGLHKHGHLIVIRDSKDPDGPKLYFDKAEFAALVLSMQDGEYADLIAV